MYVITTSYGKVRGKAKNYPYFQAALYTDKQLKNGRYVWFYVCHLGRAYRSIRLATIAAKNFGYQYKENVRHLQNIREARIANY